TDYCPPFVPINPIIHESTNPLCGSVNAKQLAQPAFQVGPLLFAKRTSFLGHLTCRAWEAKSVQVRSRMPIQNRNPNDEIRKNDETLVSNAAHEKIFSGFETLGSFVICHFGIRHFTGLSRCNSFCTPLCEGGSSWCKST